jgi:hypothetical protein
MALTNKLSAIGDAIRSKTGTTELMTLDAMSAAIEAIETGGGGSEDCDGMHIPEEALTITGDCNHRFANNGWTWFLREAGDKITTKDISNASQMFYSSSELTSIPFDINFKDGGAESGSMFGNCFYLEAIPAIDFKQTSYKSLNGVFASCKYATQIGKLSNLYPSDMGSMFSGCEYLRYLPEFENLNLDRMYTYAYSGYSSMFNGCYSLRSVPESLLKQLYNPLATSGYYTLFNNGFKNCYALDEIRGLNPQTGTVTSNMFSNTFENCHRLKEVIFATQEDGTPYTVNWKNQVIDLSEEVGYENHTGAYFKTTHYNAGISPTPLTRVGSATDYQELKNHPDWWTGDGSYGRYNRTSAVNTINSLPDTSAYLASAGGTNTIKFDRTGSNTDGGNIYDLTEAEIAVAAAKGWTVTFSS